MVLVVAALLMAGGCAKAPVQDVDSANQAMDSAVSAGAKEYAPQSMAAVDDLKGQLEAEMAAQEGKFTLFRSYDKSKELAAQMKAAGERAASDAAAAKEAAKNEATELIARAKLSVEETRAMLATAPRGKGSEIDIKVMEMDLAGTEAAILEAEGALAGGEFLAAKAKANACLESTQTIRDAITKAMEMKRR